jgi:hypothetical protein
VLIHAQISQSSGKSKEVSILKNGGLGRGNEVYNARLNDIKRGRKKKPFPF